MTFSPKKLCVAHPIGSFAKQVEEKNWVGGKRGLSGKWSINWDSG